MLSVNSEIRKYYWLDFSTQRILAMPTVLLGILLLMILLESKESTIISVSNTFILILVFLWGGHNAASSIIEEIKDNTWDNQRLSSVSPLSLSLGKLFGSTLYSWYGGIIALVIYSGYSLIKKPITVVAFEVVLLLMCGIFCHSVALLSSIQSLKSDNSYRKMSAISYLFVGIIASSIFYKTGMSNSLELQSGNKFTIIKWFNNDFSLIGFLIFSLVTFLFWSIVGIYRSMREELKFKNIPWVWAVFIIFVMFYTAGFLNDGYFTKYGNGISSLKLGSAVTCGVISLYLMLFADNLNITRYRIIFHQFRNKNWIKIGEATPKWVVSFVLTLITSVLLLFSAVGSSAFYSVCILIVSILLFITRDIAILHYFTFAPNNKRAGLATTFYLAVFYILLPSIFSAAGFKSSIYAFYPVINNTHIVSLLPVIIEVVIVGFMLNLRWRNAKEYLVA
jgi:hypothetical protein